MRVVIVGGGAAGMACAYFSALNGYDVVLVEKNEKLGKKVYITGKGRCNVTNDCEVDEFLANVVTNSRFMIGALRAFSPADTMNLLETFGLRLKVERGNRVFPISDKSSDVIKAFNRAIVRQGVEVKLNTKVVGLSYSSGRVDGVYLEDVFDNSCNKEKYFLPCERVVVCTGGISYPSTGSDGDGYRFAQTVGHTVLKPRACLCGLLLKGDFSPLAGLSLKNIGYTVFNEGKRIYDDFGELLFTHKGISGPVVLSSSSYISSAIANGNNNFKVSIDLKPALDEKTLDKRLLRDFELFKNKSLKNSLNNLLPRSIIPEILNKAELDGEISNSSVTKQMRMRLVRTIKSLDYEFDALAPVSESIVTGGGVNVKEINPTSMESKLIAGLRFAGEIIDVDALTGGFNLQCAFSTAYIAAR